MPLARTHTAAAESGDLIEYRKSCLLPESPTDTRHLFSAEAKISITGLPNTVMCAGVAHSQHLSVLCLSETKTG